MRAINTFFPESMQKTQWHDGREIFWFCMNMKSRFKMLNQTEASWKLKKAALTFRESKADLRYLLEILWMSKILFCSEEIEVRVCLVCFVWNDLIYRIYVKKCLGPLQCYCRTITDFRAKQS